MADYQLRIFTTQTELPFAGHPALGSAHAWLEAGGIAKNPESLVQQCGAGLVRIHRDGTRLAFAAPPLIRGGDVDAGDLIEMMSFLNIDPAVVVDAQWADNGPGWVALLLSDAETVLALNPKAVDSGRFSAVGVIEPHPPHSEVDFEVRAFIALGGQSEDPVTGSLNAALGQWLIGTQRAPSARRRRPGNCHRSTWPGRCQSDRQRHLDRRQHGDWRDGDGAHGAPRRPHRTQRGHRHA